MGLIVQLSVCIKHTLRIELEVFDHERIHGLPLQILIAMFATRVMDVLDVRLFAKELEHIANVGVLDVGCVFCLITSDGNE